MTIITYSTTIGNSDIVGYVNLTVRIDNLHLCLQLLDVGPTPIPLVTHSSLDNDDSFPGRSCVIHVSFCRNRKRNCSAHDAAVAFDYCS